MALPLPPTNSNCLCCGENCESLRAWLQYQNKVKECLQQLALNQHQTKEYQTEIDRLSEDKAKLVKDLYQRQQYVDGVENNYRASQGIEPHNTVPSIDCVADDKHLSVTSGVEFSTDMATRSEQVGAESAMGNDLCNDSMEDEPDCASTAGGSETTTRSFGKVLVGIRSAAVCWKCGMLLSGQLTMGICGWMFCGRACPRGPRWRIREVELTGELGAQDAYGFRDRDPLGEPAGIALCLHNLRHDRGGHGARDCSCPCTGVPSGAVDLRAIGRDTSQEITGRRRDWNDRGVYSAARVEEKIVQPPPPEVATDVR
ncbi:hypothetical protein BKA93DRAFT_750190 [Sparassis latifolia]